MKKHILFVALLGAMSSAYSQDATYDARSLAMGGAGVSAANGLNAQYQNPAMLATLTKETATLGLPVISGRLQDAGELKNNLGTLNNSANNLSAALSQFQSDVATNSPNVMNSAKNAGAAITNFGNALGLVGNKSLMGSVFGGTMLAIPSSNYSFGLQLDARAEFGGMFTYTNADQTLISGLGASLSACSNSSAIDCQNASNKLGGNGKINGLSSSFDVRGVVIGELGLAGARHVAEWEEVDIGITPKLMRITSFDITASAQSGNASATARNGNKKDDSAFNMDIGVSRQFETEDHRKIRAGVVVKNLFSKSITTLGGHQIDIAPQVTSGVSFGNRWFTGGVDLDLIKNKPLIAGFNKESQYLRFGGELDAMGWAQLRFGYRHDLTGNNPGLPSIGVGLFHVADISIAYANKKEAALAAQVGFHF